MLRISIAIILGAIIAAVDLTAMPIVFPYFIIILTPIFLILYLKFDFQRMFYFAIASGAIFDIFAPTKVGFWILILQLFVLVVSYLRYLIKSDSLMMVFGTTVCFLGINLANHFFNREVNSLNLIASLIPEVGLVIILFLIGNRIFYKKSQLPLIKF